PERRRDAPAVRPSGDRGRGLARSPPRRRPPRGRRDESRLRAAARPATAGPRTAWTDRHGGRAPPPAPSRLGTVEGRAALVPGPAPTVVARARDRRHRRPHGREGRSMKTGWGAPRFTDGEGHTESRALETLGLCVLGGLLVAAMLLWTTGQV